MRLGRMGPSDPLCPGGVSRRACSWRRNCIRLSRPSSSSEREQVPVHGLCGTGGCGLVQKSRPEQRRGEDPGRTEAHPVSRPERQDGFPARLTREVTSTNGGKPRKGGSGRLRLTSHLDEPRTVWMDVDTLDSLAILGSEAVAALP